MYYFDVHQLMQQEIPNIPQSEINKRISENWKRLSVAEKAYYLEKAKSEKEGMDTVSFKVLCVQAASSIFHLYFAAVISLSVILLHGKKQIWLLNL